MRYVRMLYVISNSAPISILGKKSLTINNRQEDQMLNQTPAVWNQVRYQDQPFDPLSPQPHHLFFHT